MIRIGLDFDVDWIGFGLMEDLTGNGVVVEGIRNGLGGDRLFLCQDWVSKYLCVVDHISILLYAVYPIFRLI